MSENATTLGKDAEVVFLGTHGPLLQVEVVLNEVLNGCVHDGVRFQILSLLEVLLGVHLRVSILEVILVGKLVATFVEDESQVRVIDLEGFLRLSFLSVYHLI